MCTWSNDIGWICSELKANSMHRTLRLLWKKYLSNLKHNAEYFRSADKELVFFPSLHRSHEIKVTTKGSISRTWACLCINIIYMYIYIYMFIYLNVKIEHKTQFKVKHNIRLWLHLLFHWYSEVQSTGRPLHYLHCSCVCIRSAMLCMTWAGSVNCV